MSRRDTIIIAVLLNAGVLAILFMLAVSEKEEVFIPASSTPALVRNEQPKVEAREIVAVKSIPEPSDDFNFDDTLASVAEETGLPIEQYVFVNEPEVIKPNKPTQPVVVSKPSVSNDSYVEVTVKRGDSLDKLARANGSTIEAIKKANQLKSDVLNIGQVLRVPVSQKLAPLQKISEPKKTVGDSTGAVYYTIKTGDSPWKIAKQNNTNVDDLLKLNNWNEEKAKNLKIGDKIRIK